MDEEMIKDLYLAKQLSSREIGEMIGKDHKTVQYHLARHGIPRRDRSNNWMKYWRRLNLTPTPGLSYVLGVLLGDGSVFITPHPKRKNSNTYTISLGTTEKSFACSFQRSLRDIGLNPSLHGPFSPRGRQKSPYWLVRAWSKPFVEWYKALTLGEIEGMIREEEDTIAFLRGFYESEGGHYVFTVDTKTGKTPVHCVKISNYKKELLDFAKRLIENLGFRANVGKVDVHLLGKSNEKLRFLRIINPCIKR